ncbi:MAG: LUD domain-containing protein [Candidatus Accumulibacter necessarius]
MSARDNILQRLRAAPQGRPPLAPDVPAFHRASARHASQHARGENRAVLREDGLLARRGRPRHARQLAAEAARDLRREGRALAAARRASAHAALKAAGIAGLKPYDRPVEEWKKELFEDTDASLTSTRGGIAETGTLIIWPDANEPRLMSLVPPIHFALLDADQLHDTLFAAMSGRAGAPACRPTRCSSPVRRRPPTSRSRSPTARTARRSWSRAAAGR